MKKIIPLMALALATAAFQSQPENKPALFRVREITNFKTGSTTTYNYDSEGRLVAARSSKGPTTTCRYEGNLVIKQFLVAVHAVSQTDTFKLNNNGLAQQENSLSGNQRVISKYRYDPNGYEVEAKDYDKDVCIATVKWVVANGNLTKYTFANDRKVITGTVLYNYYPDKFNTIGNENTGMAFRGHDSRNLQKESISLDEKGDTLSVVFYHYKFDKMGRVSEKISRYKNDALADSLGYTYY